MARGRLLLFLIAILCIGAALWWWRTHPPSGPVAQTGLRLTPVRFADLPGWSSSDPRAALSAFARSCAVLNKRPDSAPMGGAGYAGTAGDWRAACRALPQGMPSAAAARTVFQSWATPVAVASDAGAAGIFTGYYEPELRGSLRQHGIYQTPVYATPDNLFTVDLSLFHDMPVKKRITGCAQSHKLVPCPTRGAIDREGLAQARVLFYAADPIAVFFLHIQGSGRVRFDDGSMARVNYDAQNGQPYTAVGKTLIGMGVPRDGMSMQVIRRWLRDHPAEAQRVMETDKSFVFFRMAPLGDASAGAIGSEGVALTPAASLAVDMTVHPLGVPMFVAATRPDADPRGPYHPFDTLMVAQDSGGAIKNAVRGDVFWGFGPQAESVAGRMKATGKLFVLLPKPLAAKLTAHRDATAS